MRPTGQANIMHPDLIERYGSERLPRYTSYPTAPNFSTAVDASTYGRWLAAIPDGTLGSIYVHVPFCRRMCWYCGCNTQVARRDEPISAYLAALTAEIQMVGSAIVSRLDVGHVHFGGGTPTILSPRDFLTLMRELREAFAIRANAEIAIEIDPRVLSVDMATALGEAGVTRASIGVQSLDPAVQKAIGRIQSLNETDAAVANLRRAGIGAINIDLIYGLPQQSAASCIETVDACLALRPDRFAVFGYAHVPGFKKHQRKIDAATLPDSPARSRQSEAIAGRLVEAGYRPIGIDHFALPSDAMAIAAGTGRLHRNFQGYTTDPADVLIGLGASSIGRLPQGYVQNHAVLRDYTAAIAAARLATAKGIALSDEDRVRGAVIERLMCDFKVDTEAVRSSHPAVADIFGDALPGIDRLAADGLLRRDGGIIAVATEARPLVRAVAACFDAYRGAPGRTHSPAV
jgi:oxygen-independent coproporphyrinogen-3 oxidase